MQQKHYFGAQTLPINRNRIVCLYCGKVKNIGANSSGKRSKCSPTRRYMYLGDGAVGHRSIATGKITVTSGGHKEYRYNQKRG